MEPRTLEYMAEASAGQRLSGAPDTLVRRVCTDSRQVQAQDLFLALRGDRFDGHAFVPEAARKGVAGVVVETASLPVTRPNCAVIAVENTRLALGKMAARYRKDFPLPIVAVAGSNGKTTTKELLAAVLRQRFHALWSQASFNNDIGVPVTLLELNRQHQVAILEFGSNHPGELAPLLQLAQPRFGVLTSLGREHLEYFGDLDGVAQEEGWLAELLPSNGKLFLNGDSPKIEAVIRRSTAPVIRVGFAQDNDWRAAQPRADETGASCIVEAPVAAFCRSFRVALLGRHQLVNALLAIAVGAEFGLTPEEVQRGLLECAPAKMRLQPFKVNGVQILDDSYNANADSMRAALQTLHDFPCRGRRIAVLGDMGELGTHAIAAHAEVGCYAAEQGIGHLFAVGKMSAVIATAARQAGLGSVVEFAETTQAAAVLRNFLQPGDVVLIKASRAAGLDRIAAFLREGQSREPNHDIGQG